MLKPQCGGCRYFQAPALGLGHICQDLAADLPMLTNPQPVMAAAGSRKHSIFGLLTGCCSVYSEEGFAARIAPACEVSSHCQTAHHWYALRLAHAALDVIRSHWRAVHLTNKPFGSHAVSHRTDLCRYGWVHHAPASPHLSVRTDAKYFIRGKDMPWYGTLDPHTDA